MLSPLLDSHEAMHSLSQHVYKAPPLLEHSVCVLSLPGHGRANLGFSEIQFLKVLDLII